jgi:cytochrome oxidase assembly protein ShyY1
MHHPLRWLGVALLGAAICATAGVWQYGRGVEKQRMLEAFSAALSAPPVPIDVALAAPIQLPLPVQGRLRLVDAAPWLLLDNVRRGQALGVRALAIYQEDGGLPLLVDFGWLPLPPERRLPDLPPPPSDLQARGLLVPWPGQGLRLGGDAWPEEAEGRVLLTRLDREQLGERLGQLPLAALLRLDPALPLGFARDLDALPNTLPPEKHFGYALQWSGFAAAIMVIYLVLLFRTRRS